MTKTTIIKVAGLTLLAAVAVYTQNRPEKARPGLEARAEAVSSVSKAGPVFGIARKEAVQYAAGMAPQEPQEPFELTKKDTPLDLITTLINAPFNQEPGQTINDKNNWRVLAYPPEYCDPPSYSKTFRRKGPGMEISLYSYTVPSLTETKELIMAGELKIFEELDKNTARALLNITTGERRPFKVLEQNAVLDLLKSSGFTANPTEKHLSSPGGRNWTDVMEIQKGALSGLMYFEPHGSARALKIRLEHEEHLRYILPKLKTKGSSYCAFYISCNPC